MVPSKAHIKRVTRDRSRPFVDPQVPSKPVSEHTLQTRRQLEEHKKALAALGNEFRWVAPSDDVLYAARERELYTVVSHEGEQTPTSFMEHMAEEQRKIDAMRERMRARAIKERIDVKASLLAHAVAKAGHGLTAAVDASLGF